MRDLLISDCNVTDTSYTYDATASDGYRDVHEYIIKARSNVQGAVNGTSQNLKGSVVIACCYSLVLFLRFFFVLLLETFPTFVVSSADISIKDNNTRDYQMVITTDVSISHYFEN